MKRGWREWFVLVMAALVLAAMLGGCARYQETAVREVPPSDPAARAAAERPDEARTGPAAARVEEETLREADRERLRLQKLLEEAKAFQARNIHFNFDRHDLTSEARAILDELGAWMLENRNFALVIEGHCDNRGTAEYNLALGERRAESAKAYLVTLGVNIDRIRTISYGEERPLDPRNNEEAWAKNRRAQFNLTHR